VAWRGADLLAAGFGGLISVWDDRQHLEGEFSANGPVRHLRALPGGFVASVRDSVLWLENDAPFRLEIGSAIRSIDVLEADGVLVAVGTDGGDVALLDATGSALGSLSLDDGKVVSVAFVDAVRLLACTSTGTVYEIRVSDFDMVAFH